MSTALPSAEHVRIPGLSFRRFRGDADFPVMVEIMNAGNRADREEYNQSAADVAHVFSHLTNCEPGTDMLFAEVRNDPAGYSRVFWKDEYAGPRLYLHLGFVVPAWRRRGLGRVILRWNEDRLSEIGAEHPREVEKLLQVWTTDANPGAMALFESAGYHVARTMLGMTRPTCDVIPSYSLPEGLEIRPTRPNQYRAVWDAWEEGYQDHWGHALRTDDDYVVWTQSRLFQPGLWKVAWDGDAVAGMVLNYVDERRNEWVGIERGYTQDIFVLRPWRRRGLARALLAASIRMFAEMGMEETLLGVDSENPYGARSLYESLGYRAYRTHYVYRKTLAV